MHTKVIGLAAILVATLPVCGAMAETPDLVGSWAGKAEQVTAQWEFGERDVVVSIVEQKGGRFYGTITHHGTPDKIIGVIRADAKTFFWVDVNDNGQAQGQILSPDQIEVCHLEAGDHALASCALLARKH